MQIPVTLTAAIEIALNNYIALDTNGIALFKKIQGKVIAIDLIGLNLSLFFIPAHDQIHVMSHFDGDADARLRGAPASLLRMSMSTKAESQLFSGDIEITGDTELAQGFQQALKRLDVDWEEHLSHITGDVIAHQIGRGVRDLIQWGQQVQDSFTQDSAEYLVEESNLVPTINEVEKFNQSVDNVRNDLERLQARVQRLSKNTSTSGAHS